MARPVAPDAGVTRPLDEALARELTALDRAGLRRSLRRTERIEGARVMVGGRPAIDFSSNDYLGLAGDPRIGRAAAAVLEGQTGATASRSVGGNHPLHEALEAELAQLKAREAALLFPSGFAANAGAIPALVGRDDAIYSDQLNHASIIDGCRLSGAMVRRFPHADVAALADLLAADHGRFRRRLIVVEGVFSMDGDLFPLDRLVPVAREHEVAIYLDDAHGTGVMGPTGGGSAEHWGLRGEVDIVMGTLGKALGVAGAFVAGSRMLRDYLLNRARTFVFSTGSPPALAAAALAALDIMRREPAHRARLRANAEWLKAGLRAAGVDVDPALPGHIVPIVIGDSDRTVEVGRQLLQDGFLIGAIRPPSVPAGSARLRVTASAAHTPEDIDRLVGALGQALDSRR